MDFDRRLADPQTREVHIETDAGRLMVGDSGERLVMTPEHSLTSRVYRRARRDPGSFRMFGMMPTHLTKGLEIGEKLGRACGWRTFQNSLFEKLYAGAAKIFVNIFGTYIVDNLKLPVIVI